MKRFLAALVLWAIAAVPASGQTKSINSLLKNLHEAKSEQQKLHAIFALGEEYKSLNRDTLDKYAYQVRAMTINNAEHREKAEANLVMAYMYARWGWSDSTLASISDGLKFASLQDAATRSIYFKLVRQKALALGGKSRFKEALDVLYTLVVQSEQYKDTLTISTNLNTIASLALAGGNLPKPFRYLIVHSR